MCTNQTIIKQLHKEHYNNLYNNEDSNFYKLGFYGLNDNEADTIIDCPDCERWGIPNENLDYIINHYDTETILLNTNDTLKYTQLRKKLTAFNNIIVQKIKPSYISIIIKYIINEYVCHPFKDVKIDDNTKITLLIDWVYIYYIFRNDTYIIIGEITKMHYNTYNINKYNTRYRISLIQDILPNYFDITIIDNYANVLTITDVYNNNNNNTTHINYKTQFPNIHLYTLLLCIPHIFLLSIKNNETINNKVQNNHYMHNLIQLCKIICYTTNVINININTLYYVVANCKFKLNEPQFDTMLYNYVKSYCNVNNHVLVSMKYINQQLLKLHIPIIDTTRPFLPNNIYTVVMTEQDKKFINNNDIEVSANVNPSLYGTATADDYLSVAPSSSNSGYIDVVN